ncbi:FixH family protein [Rhizobium paknamense]|uniref:Nitrogen fixation protein FixH n=1 Tax=Rhizobium paknamense TaxID=1206817 RepID=A0ABU0I8S7_9HYPH|nr:FixH family protein [Rhizobium paknamense]MDQ0453860.1 nitrogen fixation protein FixH [Rhizobium paknamense]
MSANTEKPFVFTGWHMLATICSFFGVIIAVNFTMAYYATHSWSGIVVENTYVASQQFNDTTARIRAILDSGVEGRMSVNKGLIVYDLDIPGKGPVIADKVTANFKRPVGTAQDFSIELQAEGPGHFVARHEMGSGHWIYEIIALRDGQMVMHEANRMAVLEEK